MAEAKLFNCPSCGSALSPQGDAAEIKCEYCGNTVIVPEELRESAPIAEAIEVSPNTTRWIKIGIWAFVVLMILTFVLPFACSICGVLGGLVGAFAPFWAK